MKNFYKNLKASGFRFNSLILLSTIYQLKRRWRENKATKPPLKCLFFFNCKNRDQYTMGKKTLLSI